MQSQIFLWVLAFMLISLSVLVIFLPDFKAKKSNINLDLKFFLTLFGVGITIWLWWLLIKYFANNEIILKYEIARVPFFENFIIVSKLVFQKYLLSFLMMIITIFAAVTGIYIRRR